MKPSQNKGSKSKTKAEFIAENYAVYNVKFNFLPAKQIKGKLEEDWKKLYGPVNRVQPIVKKVPEIMPPKPIPKEMIKPEILITPVPEEPLEPKEITKTTTTTKCTDDDEKRIQLTAIVEKVENCADTNEDNYVDDHDDNQKKIKRKLTKKEPKSKSLRSKSKQNKLETTIELLSEDNKSLGFIESKGTDTYLKLHNGKIFPWAHSTPVRVTRNNTHFREISRLPFSPI